MSNFWKSFLCVLACIFLCVASFFTGYFFRDTVRIQQDNSLSAVSPADTVSYTFESNSMFIYYTTYPPETVEPYEIYTVNDFKSGLVRFELSNMGSYIRKSDTDYYYLDNYVFGSWERFTLQVGVQANNVRNVFCLYYISSPEFNYNVTHFTYGSDVSYYGDTRFRTTMFIFYDNNGNSFGFQFAYYNTSYSYGVNMLKLRDYYFTPDFSNTDMFNQGYQTGYESGLNSGKQEGYTNGYNSGYQDGETTGYNNGINTANTYSFSNLLTAVVEAPVNVFIKLLDFNIMGYNLLNIVLGLLTLAIVVLVIKLCLGGK